MKKSYFFNTGIFAHNNVEIFADRLAKMFVIQNSTKISRNFLFIAILLLTATIPVRAYEFQVVNLADYDKNTTVAIPLTELPHRYRVQDLIVRDNGGTILASQIDDLNGDGRMDELVFRVRVPAHGSRKIVLEISPEKKPPHWYKQGAAFAEFMWRDLNLENEFICAKLPTPWHDETRGIFEIYDISNSKKLIDFTLQPAVDRYVVEDVRQYAVGGPVRNVVTRVRNMRSADDESAIYEVVQRFIMNKKERRLDIEISITNNSKNAQSIGNLQLFDGELGEGLKDIKGDLDNLAGKRDPRAGYVIYEGRAQFWHNAATGFGFAYVPQQPDRGWQKEVVGTGYHGFASKPGSKLHLSGIRGKNLEPGQTSSFSFSMFFYDVPDRNQAQEHFKHDVDRATGGVSVYGENGKVLHIADGPVFMANGLRNPERWMKESEVELDWINSKARISTKTKGKGIYTGFTRNFDEPTELRGKVNALRNGSALEVVVEEFSTGKIYVIGTVEGNFKLDLGKAVPFTGLTKGLLHLRPVATGVSVSEPEVQLESLTMAWPTPAPPELEWPREGQSLSNVGVSFEVRSTDGSERGCELQLAYDEEFKNLISEVQIDMPLRLKGEEELMKYLPEKLLEKGTYYWRARSLDMGRNPGEWTEARSFIVDNSDPKKNPLIRPIDADHPVHFISGGAMRDEVAAGNFMKAIDKRYPKGMRDIQMQQDGYYPEKKYHIPILIHTSSEPTLPWLEDAFRNEPKVLGIVFREYGFDLAYLKRVLALAAQYGRWVSTLNIGQDMLQQSALTEDFYPIMMQYSEYFLPQHKQNNNREQISRIATEMGAWLTGRVAAWGTETEYGFAWKPMNWARGEKSQHIDHPVNWMRPFVMGLSIGACSYRTEAFSSGKWANGWIREEDQFGPLWERGMGPFFEDMVKYKLIPTKEEVLANVKVAIKGKPEYGLSRPSSESSLWPNRIFGTLHGLPYEGIPIEHILEQTWTPDWSRFYMIPVLPAYTTTDDEKLFESVIDPDDFGDPQEAVDYVSQFYKETKGDAYSVLVGNTGVVLHSIDERRDPRSVPQDFHLDFTKGPVASIEGKVNYQAYLLIKQMDDALFVHANNFEMLHTELVFHSRDGKELDIKGLQPGKSVITSRKWDPKTSNLYLELNFHKGVPRFEVVHK